MPKQFDANVLNQLANTEEIEIETRSVTIPGRTRRTIIWVMIDNNNVYIRSLRGRNGRWYQEITATPEGVIHVDGQRLAVHAVPVTDEVTIMRVSNEVLRKYHDSPSANSMVRIDILSTTLLLEPA